MGIGFRRVCRYTGFVPHARSHFGSVTLGGCDGAEKGRQVAVRGSGWGERSHPATEHMGVLPIPSMARADNPNPRGYTCPPKRVYKDDLGDLARNYGGHRPRSFDREPTGKVGTSTPARRPQSADPPRKPTRSFYNDWEVHQKHPPGPVPRDIGSYLQEVGGVTAGYSGFVPDSTSLVASSLGKLSSGPQRGHLQDKLGSMMRVQPAKGASRLAGEAAVGYSGLRPDAQQGFGMSYWSQPPPGSSELYTA